MAPRIRNHSLHRYTSFRTDLGWMAMVISSSGITKLTLPQATEKDAIAKLGLPQTALRASFERYDEQVTHIREYSRGKPIHFEDKLDLSAGTDFQNKVWASCQSIPYGQTRSYGWIATQIGKPGAARAVGNALGKNPIPIIIPCHRVVAANGDIGGYSGGLTAKRRLLKLEGVKVKDSPQR